MKSGYVLASFVWYCLTHRQERFWQALRNWSGAGFILDTNCTARDSAKMGAYMLDTFYREGRTK